MKPSLPYLTLLVASALLTACAPPKAVLVEEVVTQDTSVEIPPAAVVVKPVEPDDDLRLPDFAGMPGESELKRGPSARPPTDVPAPVISRPPLEPPTRTPPKQEAP